MKINMLLLFTLLTGCAPLISVHQLNKDNVSTYKDKEGIFYNLPKHAYDVTVTYDVVTDTKPRHAYQREDISKALLHPFPFYEKDQSIARIKTISLTPVILPDSNASYFAELRWRKLFEDVKIDITLNGYNQMASLGSESTSQLTPIVTTIATVMGGVLFKGALPNEVGSQLTEKNKEVYLYPMYTSKDKVSGVTSNKTIYLKQLESLNEITENFDALTKNSIEQLNLLNNEYLKLITIPELNDYETRIGVLKERIKFHEEYLGGKRTVSEENFIYRYEPTLDSASFTKKIYLPGDSIKLKLDFNASKLDFNNSIRKFETTNISGGSGVFYRIPMHTVLEVKLQKESKKTPNTYDDIKTDRYDITVPQFGIIRSLPPTKGYTRNFSYALDPVTGALKSYSTTHKGISNEDAKSVAATIGELEGMRNKKLERYNKELELKIKQLELNQKLDSLDSKQ